MSKEVETKDALIKKEVSLSILQEIREVMDGMAALYDSFEILHSGTIIAGDEYLNNIFNIARKISDIYSMISAVTTVKDEWWSDNDDVVAKLLKMEGGNV